tara:strand:+ start:890 stop:1054 length:165 start_codon:yes stop_codon:yes gene_type:complete
MKGPFYEIEKAAKTITTVILIDRKESEKDQQSHLKKETTDPFQIADLHHILNRP